MCECSTQNDGLGDACVLIRNSELWLRNRQCWVHFAHFHSTISKQKIAGHVRGFNRVLLDNRNNMAMKT